MNLASLSIVFLMTICAAENWAVLIAGSKGWDNFRHQASISRISKLLTSNGFEESNIITVMENDLEISKKKVFEELHVDYEGSEISPDTVFKVLTGNPLTEARGKKILKSTEADNVLLYITGHGNRNYVRIGTKKFTRAWLEESIGYMFKRNRYRYLYIVIDSCYSTTMLEGVVDNRRRVYAMASSSGDSYMLQSFTAGPDGEEVCSASAFSGCWITLLEKNMDITLDQLFEETKDLIISVQVPKKFGDPVLGQLNVRDFFAADKKQQNWAIRFANKLLFSRK